MNFNFEALRRRSQSALIDFLRTDLNLAFTLIDSAALAPDPVRVAGLLGKARDALQAIEHFVPRVDDPDASAELRAGAVSLSAALSRDTKPKGTVLESESAG